MTTQTAPIFQIGEKKIGPEYPVYTIAELSCNHNQDINVALELIDQAAQAGADAVKLQTYTADTITLNHRSPIFQIQGTMWEGQYLHDLYQKAYTPWEWFPILQERANQHNLHLFSSPFDTTAVDFLEQYNVPAYKVASFEIVDHVLLKRIAQTKKPVIMSTGMASLSEIEEAVHVLRNNGTTQLCILKCTSAYPAKPEDANLANIPHLAQTFNVIPGLSDHTLNLEVPIAATILGARVIEKHFTIDRNSGSPDDPFSLLPHEFKEMVNSVHIAQQTIGKITYGGVSSEQATKRLRRSLFAVEDIPANAPLTTNNIKSIRPGGGLHTKYYEELTDPNNPRTARNMIPKGTPLNWNLIN